MTEFGYLKFGSEKYVFEQTQIYGIVKDLKNSWWIELLPPGEENYIMLNALQL